MWNWYNNNNPVRKLKNKVEEQKMKTKNKSFKRLFAFLVALVMVTALVPSVIFAADPTFPDVPTKYWAYDHIEALAKSANIMPMVNQIECHPGYTRQSLRILCDQHGIQVEASSPLGNGTLLEQEQLHTLACAKNKSVAQICIRWALEKSIISLPKAVKCDHIRENIAVLDFEIGETEMAELDKMPFCGGLMANPDEVIDIGSLQ